MQSTDFDSETALSAAEALATVLEARTHKKKYLGKEYLLPGQLGKALKLPSIIRQLQSKVTNQRNKGLEGFANLWETLSVPTRIEVLRAIDWYDPKELDWDDKRSNRKPPAEN